jgi:hypothetical protein
MLDRVARSRVPRLGRLEETKDVLGTRGSPQSQETVIGIGESPTTADRHEARIPDLRQDHDSHSLQRVGGVPWRRVSRLAQRMVQAVHRQGNTVAAPAAPQGIPIRSHLSRQGLDPQISRFSSADSIRSV